MSRHTSALKLFSIGVLPRISHTAGVPPRTARLREMSSACKEASEGVLVVNVIEC